MALADLSFKLYTDSGLTSLFSGLHQLVHQSDLSDGDQDFQLWFGSPTTTTVLKTTVNPDVDNITITPTESLLEWAASTAYALGDTREPTVQNGFRYEVTTAGTSGAVEPVFSTAGIGSTVVDGGVIWTLVSATHEPTEAKLSTTAAGLDSATAGVALSLGPSIDAGVANAVQVNVRYTNTVTTVGSNAGNAELDFLINDVTES